MTDVHLLLVPHLSRREVLGGTARTVALVAAPAIIGRAAEAQENIVYVNAYGGS